jgi:spore germination protein GerM
LGAEASPHLVARNDVPYGLLEPAASGTTVAAPAENVTVYLEGPQHLATVSRIVPAPATPNNVLAALSRGPTSAEAADGLRSPISTAAPMSVQSVDGGLLTVDLAGAFANLAGRDQIAAVAQLLYTMTAVPGIEALEVSINGHMASVPTADGSLTKEPVTRADYASLAAP